MDVLPSEMGSNRSDIL